jgi:bacteriorhodopsin
MSFKSDMMELLILYAVLVVLSLLGIVWDIASGLLTSGLDGIFFLLVCLSMAGVFTLLLLHTAKTAGLLKPVNLFHRKAAEEKPAEPAVASANPAAKVEGK